MAYFGVIPQFRQREHDTTPEAINAAMASLPSLEAIKWVVYGPQHHVRPPVDTRWTPAIVSGRWKTGPGNGSGDVSMRISLSASEIMLTPWIPSVNRVGAIGWVVFRAAPSISPFVSYIATDDEIATCRCLVFATADAAFAVARLHVDDESRAARSIPAVSDGLFWCHTAQGVQAIPRQPLPAPIAWQRSTSKRKAPTLVPASPAAA